MPNPAIATAGEEVLVHLLKTDAAVVEMIRENADLIRIAPDQAPIGWKDKTHIVYVKVSDRRQRLISGAPTGLIHERYAIYCVDRNRSVSRVLAARARDALSVNTPGLIVGIKVWQVFVPDGETDQSLPGQDGQDAPERYRTLEAIVHYNQGA